MRKSKFTPHQIAKILKEFDEGKSSEGKPTQSFKFYYQRGFGYVGATNKKGLVSYASPV